MALALIYGWYGRGNVGDELMKCALRDIFEPRGLSLSFVDALIESEVKQADAVIFGGGSILYDAPNIEKGAWEILIRNLRPVFYLGVGFETGINDMHLKLMGVARSIITRSAERPDALSHLNVYGMPDLVYSLPVTPAQDEPGTESVLIIPNAEVIPTHQHPHWAHIGWERFQDEMAQFLDLIIDEGERPPTFLLMCKNETKDDAWGATAIISRMKHRSSRFNVFSASHDPAMTSLFPKFKVVITQRYHGIVLSQMAGVPHVSIDHHDKLKNAWPRKGINIPYHGITKAQLIESYKLAKATERTPASVPRELYDRLASAVIDIVVQERKTRGEPIRGSA
jgi:hypothetical protein